MALTGLGWRSLDAVEAVAAVHAVEDREELYRIAEEAIHPEARRLALLKLGDQEKMSHLAEWDVSPVVRRRMVRELNDEALLEKIAKNDKDRSVTEAAFERLDELRSICTIRITGETAPPPDREDSVPEWKQIQELFAKELQALRSSLPRESRFFSKTEIEPVKYSEDREVLLLRTTVRERDGSVSYGAAVLNLETGEYYFQDGALVSYTKREMDNWEKKTLFLDLNRGGWLLLAGDGKTLRTYDIADKKGKILLRNGMFDFVSFLDNNSYILLREWNKISVLEAETGTVCTAKRMQQKYREIYLTGRDSFVLRDGQHSVLCRIEWNRDKCAEKDDRILNWFR